MGYIDDESLIRFAPKEIILELKDDEIVVFKSFFRAGLQLPMYKVIADQVLKKYEIYTRQLTPNVIVKLSVFIWAL